MIIKVERGGPKIDSLLTPPKPTSFFLLMCTVLSNENQENKPKTQLPKLALQK
jgi:hypothetical protein